MASKKKLSFGIKLISFNGKPLFLEHRKKGLTVNGQYFEWKDVITVIASMQSAGTIAFCFAHRTFT